MLLDGILPEEGKQKLRIEKKRQALEEKRQAEEGMEKAVEVRLPPEAEEMAK